MVISAIIVLLFGNVEEEKILPREVFREGVTLPNKVPATQQVFRKQQILLVWLKDKVNYSNRKQGETERLTWCQVTMHAKVSGLYRKTNRELSNVSHQLISPNGGPNP